MTLSRDDKGTLAIYITGFLDSLDTSSPPSLFGKLNTRLSYLNRMIESEIRQMLSYVLYKYFPVCVHRYKPSLFAY